VTVKAAHNSAYQVMIVAKPVHFMLENPLLR
jgi:hypothetical protein